MGSPGTYYRDLAAWPLPPDSPTDYTVTEGTVTDGVTGLMWQRQFAEPRQQIAAVDFCDDLELEGHTDWRLPTRIELLSLVDFAVSAPAINATAFPGTPADGFWTSVPHAWAQSDYWAVDFQHGGAGRVFRGALRAVRCVRGAELQWMGNWYELNEWGAFDSHTGLTWMTYPISGSVTWASAFEVCSVDGWRLPSARELQSIVLTSIHGPAWDQGVFLDYPSDARFWTSTTSASNPGQAWSVDGWDGASSTETKIEALHARCVRD